VTLHCERALIVVVAGVASIAIAFGWVRKWHRETPTSTIVDNTADVTAILERRREDGPPALPVPAEAAGEPFAKQYGLVREHLLVDVALTFFPALTASRNVYDPVVWFVRRPNKAWRRVFSEHHAGGWTVHANAHGFRGATEVAEAKPDLRILFAGDSQLDGVCADTETIAERVEWRLSERREGDTVEVLNGAVGAHNPYNYLGTLERFLALRPDVFVVFVYGGNDFKGMMPIHRYFHRSPAPSLEPISPAILREKKDVVGGFAYSELGQLIYFVDNPEDRDVAVETLDKITRTIRDLCAAREITLLMVYLPPPLAGNGRMYVDHAPPVLEAVGLAAVDVAMSDTMADAWIEDAARAEVPVLDLRGPFERAEERLFWDEGHLNLRGNELVASRVANALQVILQDSH